MHAHDRMLGLQLPAADALVVRLPLGGTGRSLEPMDAAQPINDATHRLRETLVGHREIGPERVAAVGRNGHAAEDGSLWRVQRGGDVRMPPGPRSLRARATIGLSRAELGDRVDLGEISIWPKTAWPMVGSAICRAKAAGPWVWRCLPRERK